MARRAQSLANGADVDIPRLVPVGFRRGSQLVSTSVNRAKKASSLVKGPIFALGHNPEEAILRLSVEEARDAPVLEKTSPTRGSDSSRRAEISATGWRALTSPLPSRARTTMADQLRYKPAERYTTLALFGIPPFGVAGYVSMHEFGPPSPLLPVRAGSAAPRCSLFSGPRRRQR